MAIKDILATIDEEIARLKQVRTLLAQDREVAPAKVATKRHARHKMSAEGRKKVAEAQRKRWAAQKKVGK